MTTGFELPDSVAVSEVTQEAAAQRELGYTVSP